MFAAAKSYLKSHAPGIWHTGRTTRKLLKLIPRVYGYEPRRCPICAHEGRFFAEIHFPDIFVFDAICPKCSSNSRNRLLKIAVDQLGLMPPSSSVLHFAPERPVRRFVEPAVAHYKTADLDPRGVDLQINIEAIAQPDESWDVIICSHVLEHVDHHKALAELRRILKPNGKLLAFFPIVEPWSAHYENDKATSPRDRGLHFGKENHLRRFGGVVRDDFATAGFKLEEFAPIGPEVVEFGLIPGETLFIASRG